MIHLKYEQAVADDTVKTVADLDPPENTTHVELQADSAAPVRFTLDGDTDNPTFSGGFILPASTYPYLLLTFADFKNIRFRQAAGTATKLNLHYLSGRDV